jgi:hypothetical protein
MWDKFIYNSDTDVLHIIFRSHISLVAILDIWDVRGAGVIRLPAVFAKEGASA